MRHRWLLAVVPWVMPVVSSAQVAPLRTQIAGHRAGFYQKFPESSLVLIDHVARAFTGDTLIVEVDLRRSRDGTIWIMHDETVDRTTTGHGRLETLADSTIRTLRLRTADGTVTAERVPTFAELLTSVRDRNLQLMLDIKEPLHERAVAQVRAAGMERRVLTLTFDRAITQRLAALAPDIALSALIVTNDDWQAFRRASMQDRQRIAYVTAGTSAALITTMRQEGVRIMADVSESTRHGGVPRPSGAYRTQVVAQQLDILITDYPIEARAALLTLPTQPLPTYDSVHVNRQFP